MAIARYATKLVDLFPEGPLEAAGIGTISETLNELAQPVLEIAHRTRDQELKANRTKTYLEETLPKSFALLESKVQGKFFLGDNVSYADVHLFSVVLSVQTHLATADLSTYSKLLAVADQIKANSAVAADLNSQCK